MALQIGCGSEFGRTVARLDAGSVRVTETEYDPYVRIPDHYHPTPQLCLVLAGAYHERYRRWGVHCEPATVIYHAPGHVHSDEFAEAGGRCLNISYGDDRYARSARGAAERRIECSRRAVPRWRVFMLRRRLELGGDLSALELEEACLELLDEFVEGPGLCVCGRPPAWLEEVRERVHRTFRDPPTLAELADGAGVHRVHVARAFRRHFGCTVGDYIRQRRVELASRLLSEVSTPLSTVAYRTGFADQAHLTRTFKMLIGLTPGRFRARLTRT